MSCGAMGPFRRERAGPPGSVQSIRLWSRPCAEVHGSVRPTGICLEELSYGQGVEKAALPYTVHTLAYPAEELEGSES